MNVIIQLGLIGISEPIWHCHAEHSLQLHTTSGVAEIYICNTPPCSIAP
jgi:hypothetical protein